MNTVSTLCATTTVGAAAVGYAFGLPPSPSGPDTADPRSPKRTPQHGTERLGTSAERKRFLPTESYRVFSLGSRPPSTVLESLENRPGLDGEDHSPMASSTFTTSRSRDDGRAPDFARNRHEKPHQLDGGDHQPLSFFRRQSRPASWALSPSSNLRPSLHPGSVITSITQETPVKPLVPNKLVKRSLSLGKRSLSGPVLTGGSHWKDVPPNHQPSATFPRHLGRANTSSIDADPPYDAFTPSPELRIPYRQYFKPVEEDRGNSPRLPRKQPAADFGGIRRIQPCGSQRPVLLLGGLIAPASAETGPALSNSSTELEVVNGRQRTEEADPISSPSINTGDDCVLDGQKRRSFSISNFLSGNLLSRRTHEEGKPRRRRLQRPLSQRITSAPITGIENGQSNDDRSTSIVKPWVRTPSVGGLESSPSTKEGRKDLNEPYPEYGCRSARNSGNISPSLNSPSLQMRNRHILLRESQSPDLSSSSVGLTHITSRPGRLSETPSDVASSQLGSEADARIFSSGDEDDGDLRSDTIYDSMRTDITRGTSRFPDLLFDEDLSAEHESSHSTNFHNSMFSDTSATTTSHNDVIVEEDESVPTPIGLVKRSASPKLPCQNSKNSTSHPGSSSPSMLQPLSLAKLNWDSGTEEDEFAWSGDDKQSFKYDRGLLASGKENVPHHSSDWVHDDAEGFDNPVQPAPSKPFELSLDHDVKHSVFDWSEQFAVERKINNVPVRPKTVHGKKNRDGRGSRSNGRRAPSGPHARSQSVPVLPDQSQSRVGIASKFGTWGIGSKGATEDWDDDFDFSGPSSGGALGSEEGQDMNVNQAAIVVPQTIREQQTSVLANIGLLKEWGLLIEELKELRKKAILLALEPASFQATFDEVDAMIDLADQEAQEDCHSPLPLQPPTSPSLEELKIDSEIGTGNSASNRASWQPLEEDDVFESSQLSSQTSAPPVSDRMTPRLTGRARKNSEAIARSVIQAVQRRRAPIDATAASLQPPPTSKVPFDKGTLRHILPHLTSLVKAMKAILRDAEGLSSSPKQQIKRPDPAFSQAFIAPPPESPTDRGRLRLRLESVGVGTTESQDLDIG